MVERRWLWTVPMYVVVCVTVVLALRGGWGGGAGAVEPAAGPRERRAAPPGPSTLIDLPDFRFHHLQDRCNATRPTWVGIVSSAPHHFYHRRLIRNTWADKQQVVFLLGMANATVQPLIEKEARSYGDIIQGNFIDSYRNLTYKHVMGLLWTKTHCPGASYILKTDDDVFVNTAYLDSYLSSLPDQRLIFCPLMKASLVQRSYRSKWRVTPEEYSGRWYPPYCAGWVILYSKDAVNSIYSEAQKEPYFWIDDVHISGTIAQKLNLTHTPIGALGLSEEATENVLGGNPSSNFLFSLTGPKNFERLWSMVNDVSSYDIE